MNRTINKLRIVLHVFGYGNDGTQHNIEIWEVPFEGQDGANPLLLQSDGPEGRRNHLFSLSHYYNHCAVYYPVATHKNLPLPTLRGDLPKYGWKCTKTISALEDLLDYTTHEKDNYLASMMWCYGYFKTPKEAADALGLMWTEEDQQDHEWSSSVSDESVDKLMNKLHAIKEREATNA